MQKHSPNEREIDEKKVLYKAGHELRTTRHALRAAKYKFDDIISKQAKRECRLLCEKVYEKLPQELRDMIYESIIADHNATFFHGKNGTTSIANGTSRLQHCFELGYIGTGMYRDMVARMGSIGSRFDFRGRHELLRFRPRSGLSDQEVGTCSQGTRLEDSRSHA